MDEALNADLIPTLQKMHSLTHPNNVNITATSNTRPKNVRH